MPYGELEEVKRLSGGPKTSTVTDEEVTDCIISADDEINIKTGKFDWSSQDLGYKTVKKASNYLAASNVIIAWDPDNLDKADDLRRQGLDLINSLINGKFPGGNSSVVIGVTSYATYQLNDELEPFMSTY